ncbi:hypothetical protein QR680_014747 [Steinernema hermaphroditum]|uniref:C-type lectin domain-containing protein n=1 Tax=Steinernema hermaphroditum TaxID=289476 RepID=A0AA39M3R3_9BILA|nr:hypothetical protein QR680_014747 [Steinernema hermaphroditum]
MKITSVLFLFAGYCACAYGLPHPNTTQFVFGGAHAREGQFPTQAYIKFKKTTDNLNWQCGGSLISTRHILTAAHCTYHMKAPHKIMVGATNIKDNTGKAQWRDITKIHTHSGYNEDVMDEIPNDIAVVEFSPAVTLNDDVQLARFVENDEELLKLETALISGYGVYKYEGPKKDGVSSNDLLFAEVDLHPFSYCNQAWWGLLKDYQICAGSKGHGTGNGDSGGPLQVTYNNVRYQIGLTSFGVAWDKDIASTQQDKYPPVYTRISSFCDFIANVTDRVATCERLPEAVSTPKPTTAEPPMKAHNFGNYILSTTELSFQDAKDFCESIGAKMLTPHKKGTEKIIQRIFNQLKPDDAHIFWLGLYKPEGIRSQYAWLDGSALNYRNWAKGLPIPTPSEECAAHWEPNWVGMDCNWKYSFNENIVSVSAENLPIRAKRYEYHVSMPFSSVRIKGTNPLIEGIRTLGRLSDLFQYFRRRY